MPIRLVLADDHPIVLKGLDRLFEGENGFQVVALCADGEQALEAARREQPDIAVLDVAMPKIDGITVARRIRQEGLATKVVLLTATLEDHQLVEAVQAGVTGVVLKEMAADLLVQCLNETYLGRHWIEKSLAGRALSSLLSRQDEGQRAVKLLTAREIEIVRLVARGLRNKIIAYELSIAEGTVKIHLNRIYEKLGINNRVELTNFAQKQRLVAGNG